MPCLTYRTSSVSGSSLSFLWELVYIVSIGQGARRRERKYKGRRGESGRGRTRAREKEPGRIDGPRTTQIYLTNFFHIKRRETGRMYR